jgi:hypothetical protein
LKDGAVNAVSSIVVTPVQQNCVLYEYLRAVKKESSAQIPKLALNQPVLVSTKVTEPW